MEGPLPLDKRAHRLELVEGPTPIDGGVNLKYIVRVSNLSDEVWASAGPVGRELGIFLGYHIMAADGSVLEFSNPCTAIPFVHIPDIAHYMSISRSGGMARQGWRFCRYRDDAGGRRMVGFAVAGTAGLMRCATE